MKALMLFIKDEFIKKKLFEESVYIDNFEDVKNIAININDGNYFNIIFNSSYLKESFLNTLKCLRSDLNIINCNSSLERFYDNNFDGLIVFDNIKKCKDNKILEEIKKYNAILIC